MIGSAKAISEWIRVHDDIAVFTHFRPDGDAFGTSMALVHAIRLLGKRAFPVCADPAEEKYRFLPGIDRLSNGTDMPFAPKAALGADVSESSRLGVLEESFLKVPETAVLDHHATNTGFGDVCFVDETAASAGEMALEVIEELGVPFTKEIAVCLFTAISTDCGNFSFKNTSARSYRYAAKCVEAGVDVEEMTRRLFRMRSLQKTRLLGRALDHIEMFASGRIAAIRIPQSMFDETGASHADTHSIVNYLNEIDGVSIGFVAEEQADGVKFSFRAAHGANVALLAKEFGGGGHVAASGANVPGAELNEVFEKAAKAAEKYLPEMN